MFAPRQVYANSIILEEKYEIYRKENKITERCLKCKVQFTIIHFIKQGQRISKIILCEGKYSRK